MDLKKIEYKTIDALKYQTIIKAEGYNEQSYPVDTFYWECDNMLKEDDEIQS